MRAARWTIGLAMLGALLPQLTYAQEMGGYTPYDRGVEAYGAAEDNGYGPASSDAAIAPVPPPPPYYMPGDEATATPQIPEPRMASVPPKAATPQEPAPSAATASPAVAPTDSDAVCQECGPAAPWRVPQPCFFQNHGITWGGWTQLGGTVNGWNPPSHFNGPVATNDRNEFQMNQLWIFFDKPVNTGGCGWDWGGHIDIAYGSDWRFGSTFGLENRINSPNNWYGLVLPQHYLTVGVNDLIVKMGHFSPGFGYEAVPSPANFFYSHSYAMSYSEPLLVTGLQADYKLTDQLTLVAGFNRGWMMYEDLNTSLDVVGGFRWISEDQRTQLAYMTTTGPQDPGNANNRFAYSLVVQQQLNDRWQYVIQHNLGTEAGTSSVVPGGQAAWFGIDQYLFYQINEKWKAGLRFEWFQDSDGSRVQGVGNWIGSNRGWQGGPGFAGDFYELTLGLNWRPHANIVFRPEVRWDWYGGTPDVATNLPFNDGLNASQFTAAMDLIVTF